MRTFALSTVAVLALAGPALALKQLHHITASSPALAVKAEVRDDGLTRFTVTRDPAASPDRECARALHLEVAGPGGKVARLAVEGRAVGGKVEYTFDLNWTETPCSVAELWELSQKDVDNRVLGGGDIYRIPLTAFAPAPKP